MLSGYQITGLLDRELDRVRWIDLGDSVEVNQLADIPADPHPAE
jgi:hypothetical protein